MMKQAEEKKRDVRREIAKMRRTFKSLLEKNDGLPPHLQLKKDVSLRMCALLFQKFGPIFGTSLGFTLQHHVKILPIDPYFSFDILKKNRSKISI